MEWLQGSWDVSWLRVPMVRSADWFEVIWVGVFLLTLLTASYNWWDAKQYFLASKLPGMTIGARLLAPKDLRAARFGIGKAVIGLLIGTPLLFVPSGNYNGPAPAVMASLILRVGFIGIGALIAATATNDFLFRRNVRNLSPKA